MEEKEEMKFGPEEDKLYRLLDPGVCEYKRPGEPFVLRETDKAGKAAVTIETDLPCFTICSADTAGTLPFFTKDWDAVTKCADHIVFLFDREYKKWSLHIFELKRSIDEKKWNNTVVKQFSGALVRAFAIGGIMRIYDFDGIYLHCCYCENKADLSRRHARLGRPAPEDFLKKPVDQKVYSNLMTKNCPIRMEREKPEMEPCATVRLDSGGCTALYLSAKQHLL